MFISFSNEPNCYQLLWVYKKKLRGYNTYVARLSGMALVRKVFRYFPRGR